MITLQDPEKIKEIGEFHQKITKLNQDYIHFWMDNTLFHWDFILSWCLTIIPWIVWFRYRRKESTGRLLLAGFFAIIISSWLDFLGTQYGVWFYTGLAIPTIPSYIPWDFCLIPVLIMFILQIKPNISPYLKAMIFSLFCSFIAGPIFIFLGLYQEVNWNAWWSAPIYFIIYLICHRLSNLSAFEKL